MCKKLLKSVILFNLLFFKIAGYAVISLYPVAETLDKPLIELYETDPFIQKLLKRGPGSHGWFSGIYEGPWVGYAKNIDRIGAQLREGAYIYMTPSENSCVLTRYKLKDEVYLKADVDPQWLSVTLIKPIKLYFKYFSNPVSDQSGDSIHEKPVQVFDGVLQVVNKTIENKFYKYALVNNKEMLYLNFDNMYLAQSLADCIDKRVNVQGYYRVIKGLRTLDVSIFHLL